MAAAERGNDQAADVALAELDRLPTVPWRRLLTTFAALLEPVSMPVIGAALSN